MQTLHEPIASTNADQLRKPGGLVPPKRKNVHFFESSYAHTLFKATNIKPDTKDKIVVDSKNPLAAAHPNVVIQYESLLIPEDVIRGDEPINELEIARSLGSREGAEPNQVGRTMVHHLLAVSYLQDGGKGPIDIRLNAVKDFIDNTPVKYFVDDEAIRQYRQASAYILELQQENTPLTEIVQRVNDHLSALQTATEQNIAAAIAPISNHVAVILPDPQPRIQVVANIVEPRVEVIQAVEPLHAIYQVAESVARQIINPPESSAAPEIIITSQPNSTAIPPQEETDTLGIDEKTAELAQQEILPQHVEQSARWGSGFELKIPVQKGMTINLVGALGDSTVLGGEQLQLIARRFSAYAASQAKNIAEDPITGIQFMIAAVTMGLKSNGINNLNLAIYANKGKTDFISVYGEKAFIYEVNLGSKAGKRIFPSNDEVKAGDTKGYRILKVGSSELLSYVIGVGPDVPGREKVERGVFAGKLDTLFAGSGKNVVHSVKYIPPEVVKKEVRQITAAKERVRAALQTILTKALAFTELQPDKNAPGAFDTEGLLLIKNITGKFKTLTAFGRPFPIEALTSRMPIVGTLLKISERIEQVDDNFIQFIKQIDAQRLEEILRYIKKKDDLFTIIDLPDDMYSLVEQLLEYVKKRQQVISGLPLSASSDIPTQPTPQRGREQAAAVEELSQTVEHTLSNYTTAEGSFKVEINDASKDTFIHVIGAPKTQGSNIGASYILENTFRSIIKQKIGDGIGRPEAWLGDVMAEALIDLRLVSGVDLPKELNIAVLMKYRDEYFVVRSGADTSVTLVTEDPDQPLDQVAISKVSYFMGPPQERTQQWYIENITRAVRGKRVKEIVLAANGLTPDFSVMRDVRSVQSIINAIENNYNLQVLDDGNPQRPTAVTVAYLEEENVALQQSQTRLSRLIGTALKQ